MNDMVLQSGGVKGYPILHRGEVKSNSLRRKQGGYFDDGDGPCSPQNTGKVTNYFHRQGDKKNSLEEMHMAFMEEGGIYLPDDGQIGETKVLPGVGRSQAFRCVASDENKSEYTAVFMAVNNTLLTRFYAGAGARIAGAVRKRGILPKGSKSDTKPSGKHGPQYPQGAFIMEVINYGAL